MANDKHKDYVLSEVQTVPESKFGKKPAVHKEPANVPKVSKRRGWALISEPLPPAWGVPEKTGNVYDEVLDSFVTSRKKIARVVIEGKSQSAIAAGLYGAVKRSKTNGVLVRCRKVDGDERCYLIKE